MTPHVALSNTTLSALLLEEEEWVTWPLEVPFKLNYAIIQDAVVAEDLQIDLVFFTQYFLAVCVSKLKARLASVVWDCVCYSALQFIKSGNWAKGRRECDLS